MDAAKRKKLDRVLAAYRRRFPMRSDDEVVSVRMGGGGYAYVTNATTGHGAMYDISYWRVRFVEETAKAK